MTAPGIVYHRICDDKSARTFKSLLGDYEGWVVADALGTHEAGARDCRGVRLAACWAHVLRRFRDAVVDFPTPNSCSPGFRTSIGSTPAPGHGRAREAAGDGIARRDREDEDMDAGHARC